MKLFRYESRQIAQGYMSECDDWVSCGPKTKVDLNEYDVLKETEKGYWIRGGSYNSTRKMKMTNFIGQEYEEYVTFVLKGIGKRFAYPTKELALESFQLRKKRQILILTNQLRNAENALLISKDL